MSHAESPSSRPALRTAFAILVAIVPMAMASGCATEKAAKPSGLAWLPWNTKSAEQPSNLPPSPKDQIAQLRELAKNAEKLPPEQQTKAAADLRTVYQGETDAVLRGEIVRAMGRLPGPDSAAVIQIALEDEDPDVRILACEALSASRVENAGDRLAAMLAGDANRDVRMAAARALGKLGNQGMTPALAKGLDDSDPAMQHCTVLALRDLTGQNIGNDVDAWREFVASGAPPAEPSLLARMGGWFR